MRATVLSLEGVHAGYGDGADVVRGASLAVAPGRTVGLLGPSGCGKSTLLRVAAGLLRPRAGSVTVDGTPRARWGPAAPRQQRRAVALLHQSPRLAVDPRWPLRRTVSAYAAPGAPVDDLVDAVGLGPDLLGRLPHELSDGQLQRAALARALAQRPRYLLCDEMTSMLDASTSAALVALVRRSTADLHLGVVAVSHDEDLLRAWCDEVVRWR